MNKKVIIIGAGGHSRVIADIIHKCGDEVVGYLDDKNSSEFPGDPVIGKVCSIDEFKEQALFIIGIGNNETRGKIAGSYDIPWYTAIHPSAVIAENVVIEEGSVVMANAVINPSAVIGRHCIINTGAIVEHDCRINDYVHVSPNCSLGGTCSVGDYTHVGIGVSVRNNVDICSHCIIGAGAVVIRNIIDKGTYTGVPARKSVKSFTDKMIAFEERKGRVLVIAPHADDEIIGVGGTIIKELENGKEVYICIVTRAAEPIFHEDMFKQIRKETMECHNFLGITKTIFLDFPAVMLERVNRYEINAKILEVIEAVEPDEVYIPHTGDMQKDHQIVSEAAMVALRPKYRHVVRHIYAYEILSETGWNIPNTQNEFIPNAYSAINKFLDKKLEAMKIYASQLGDFPNPRSLEAIEALAKYRGAMVNTAAAEAFALIREIR